jgi:GxxExxY protein
MARRADAKKEDFMNVFEFRERGTSGVDEATEDLAERAIGALVEVHKHLGPGLPEVAYRKAVEHEFKLRNIPFQREVPVTIEYKGKVVADCRLDFVVGGVLIIELKVVEALNDVHRAPLLSYLRATRLQLGLLVNFNVTLLRNGIKRVINTT